MSITLTVPVNKKLSLLQGGQSKPHPIRMSLRITKDKEQHAKVVLPDCVELPYRLIFQQQHQSAVRRGYRAIPLTQQAGAHMTCQNAAPAENPMIGSGETFVSPGILIIDDINN
jgi:hypothetical protein